MPKFLSYDSAGQPIAVLEAADDLDVRLFLLRGNLPGAAPRFTPLGPEGEAAGRVARAFASLDEARIERAVKDIFGTP